MVLRSTTNIHRLGHTEEAALPFYSLALLPQSRIWLTAVHAPPGDVGSEAISEKGLHEVLRWAGQCGQRDNHSIV